MLSSSRLLALPTQRGLLALPARPHRAAAIARSSSLYRQRWQSKTGTGDRGRTASAAEHEWRRDLITFQFS
jgi:hypothetical protein